MNPLYFGLRNLSRGRGRFAIVVLPLGVAFFLLLVTQAIRGAVEAYTTQLKETVDNSLQVRARGSMGHVNMVGNDQILPQPFLNKVRALPHVAKVEPYLLGMSPTTGHNFAMHVGVVPGDTFRLESHGEAGNPRIIAGRALVPEDSGKDVGVIGQRYAAILGVTPENLDRAAPTIDLTRTHPVIFALDRPKRTIRIVGIYASGYVFGDTQLFMPLDTFRDIYGVKEGISWLFVRATSSDKVAELERNLRQLFGEMADVIAPTAAAEFARETTGAVSLLSILGAALAAALAAIVTFFVMLLVVRQRTREIGTLKAIGAGNRYVVTAFFTEAVLLCLAGAMVGALLFTAVGAPVAGQVFAIGLTPFLEPQYQDTLAPTLSFSSQVDANAIAALVMAGTVVAVLGSLLGVLRIIRLSPLEAMRHE
jgi:ABC-type lipoprotein release transport system permease subunit